MLKPVQLKLDELLLMIPTIGDQLTSVSASVSNNLEDIKNKVNILYLVISPSYTKLPLNIN